MKKNKLIPFTEAPVFFQNLKQTNKTIVQCHGTFDLIHPGHLIHFEEAAKLGDILVVTLTEGKFVNKGPGRPYFNDQLRIKYLASLELVDYVVLIPYQAAVEAIECVKPDIYCKGKEYQDTANDVTGNIHDDIKTVEKYGGKMAYVGSVVFSSTQLLNQHFDVIDPEIRAFCRHVSHDFSPHAFRKAIDSFADLKVLVIGDIIFDRYSTVEVQGLTSKNMILSSRYIDDETQAGGSLAVYRHIKQFTPHVKLMGLVGHEHWIEDELSKHIDQTGDLVIRAESFTTIVKQRYISPVREGQELSKLFSVNYIDNAPPCQEIVDDILAKLEKQIDDFDLVIVMDFGHGMLKEPIRRFIENRAKLMALNCQTNSNNFGFNIINQKYLRTDFFSLDYSEISLACGKKDFDSIDELSKLRSYFESEYCWFTRGSVETIGLRHGEETAIAPPFESDITDTVGAGDAFCSVAFLAAAKSLPVKHTAFIGQLAGAQAVKIVGNRESIQKTNFIKAGMALLS